jgi:hypothetical protein
MTQLDTPRRANHEKLLLMLFGRVKTLRGSSAIEQKKALQRSLGAIPRSMQRAGALVAGVKKCFSEAFDTPVAAEYLGWPPGISCMLSMMWIADREKVSFKNEIPARYVL